MRRTGAESTARIVPTPELIKQMLVQRPPGWAWATFASVVFQRWAAVEQRKVQTGPLDSGLRVIESGLKGDDKVVVAGLLRAIPGQKVDPQLQKIDMPRAPAK